jgi:hypothetical protein
MKAFDERDSDTGLFALIKSLGQFMIGYEQQGSVQVVGVLPHLGAEDVRQMARETSGLVRLTERKRHYDVISQLYDLVDLYTEDDPPSVILTLEMDRRQVFNRKWAESP